METPSITVRQRRFDPQLAMCIMNEEVFPLLARILASRNLASASTISGNLRGLHYYGSLKGAAEAAEFLGAAIRDGRNLLVVADYDCDGATACAVAVRGLRAFGAKVEYIVPDRMVHGYGLTPSVVELAMERFPDTNVIITVDNGIASHAGVERANELGLDVLITDHHLPAKGKPLPPAKVIVDPSQPGCEFPSKALAGVGVIWYVMWALQYWMSMRNLRPAEFRVSSLLPLVAVGTVADVVPLDANNRILVQEGLRIIRNRAACPGIEALATVGPANKTEISELITSDIAFGIGPRLNAAGRLETMNVGIDCLLTDDRDVADHLAERLNEINQHRKEIEHETVIAAVKQAEPQIIEGAKTITVHSDDWHAGVIGIVAGRIKEQHYRPTFVLTTNAATGQLKGSGRSIPGFNLKDALDQVDKAHPGLLLKFGGHAMAAGVTLRPNSFEEFRDAFEHEASKVLTEALLRQTIEHDGSLSGTELSVWTANLFRRQPWGQMFPEPSFCDTFEVLEAKLVGAHKDQLSLLVEREGVQMQATRFRHEGPIPKGNTQLVYKLQRHRTKFGKDELRLLIEAIVPDSEL